MESVTIHWIVFYVFIGLSSVQLVRFAGPLAIGGQYTVEELYPSDESGRLNVAYRILAPTICCQLPVFIMAAICDAFSVPGPSLRYMPTLFYWLFLGVIKHARGKLRYRTLPFSFEAFMSLLLSVAFDHFVIDGYLGGQGLDVLDTSSIAFEFELALFGVVTFWISTFFKRYQIKFSRVYSNAAPSYVVPSDSVFGYSSIDTGEARLFSYEREYGDLLPQRFSSDLLLRSVFFAIMAIEDGNRPEFIRTIERMAAHFHLAKTTGIMQQTSDAPLSDMDSVKLAIPYIERMWDQFLVEFARSAEGAGETPYESSSVTTPTITVCCRGLSAIILRRFTGTIVERDYLMLIAYFAMFLNLRKGSATDCFQRRFLRLDRYAPLSLDGFLGSTVIGPITIRLYPA